MHGEQADLVVDRVARLSSLSPRPRQRYHDVTQPVLGSGRRLEPLVLRRFLGGASERRPRSAARASARMKAPISSRPVPSIRVRVLLAPAPRRRNFGIFPKPIIETAGMITAAAAT